ncbi:MAG: mRNA interferase RelE/StbE [Frankiaceae bacterium]|nr:mRNA interferase RelE/StbE [Frankiaceae bacterium]
MRPAVIEFLVNGLATDPYRVGHPLERELLGLHSARRGEYRVIYEIRAGTREVIVLRTQHRRDAYRPR